MANFDITAAPARRKGAKPRKSIIELCGGEVRGRLTIIGETDIVKENYTKRAAICICECGTRKIIEASLLKIGSTQSCGCLRAEKLSKMRKTHGDSGNNAAEYVAWSHMKRRCTPGYKNHGGRGISVCDQWKNDYPQFLKDMGRRPSSEHSLDRWPDNDGNYEPSNCRWATPTQQARNKRNNVKFDYDDKTGLFLDFSVETGLKMEWIYHQVTYKGLSVSEIAANVTKALEKYL